MQLGQRIQKIKSLYAKVSHRRRKHPSEGLLKKKSSIRIGDKSSINVTDVDEAIESRKKKSSFNLKTVIFKRRNRSNGHFLNKIVVEKVSKLK